MKTKFKYQIQYRDYGRWVNGNTYPIKEDAERYAKKASSLRGNKQILWSEAINRFFLPCVQSLALELNADAEQISEE